MRIVNGVICVLLFLFAAVQYNDPDFLLWATIYGIGAAFAGIAALRPEIYASGAVTSAYGVFLALSLGGVVYYWPDAPRWWAQDVWWITETAREGMGMMIVLVAMLVAGVTVLRARRA